MRRQTCKYSAPLCRLANVVRLYAALLVICVFTSSGLAQMPKPNPEAYDTPPVLIGQDGAQSIHQELVQPIAKAGQVNETGIVLLSVTVNLQGLPTHVFAVRGGNGLDQKAVEAVRRDRFKPALKDGKPVMATIYVKVTFPGEANSGM
ncbi:MAG TPA: energy transducer TonB [Edaphobacter sp.]|jgi:TonB family protein|nr:energy transducer TonB [Edaphobacter sp.]